MNTYLTRRVLNPTNLDFEIEENRFKVKNPSDINKPYDISEIRLERYSPNFNL
jgi:hypothetical protein